MTVTVNRRVAGGTVTQQMSSLARLASSQPTVRRMTFKSFPDLHAFQLAITGHVVRFDGLCSLFSIQRRRAVVAINKKLEATRVRLQIVAEADQSPSSVQGVKILAFFQDFAAADAIILDIKAKDRFEAVKQDKSGRYAVKLVEAQFGLSSTDTDRDNRDDEDERDASHGTSIDPAISKRFVNLEGLDFLEERDDITVAFDEQKGQSTLHDCGTPN